MSELHGLPPGFTNERLAQIVWAMRTGTASAVEDYRPEKGDTPWSLGCTAFDRRKFHIARLAEGRDWLSIVASSPEFIFAIDGFPVKHFKGEPDEPPLRAFVRRPRELDAIQRALPFERAVIVQPLLRLILTADEGHRLSGTYLFQLSEDGAIYDRWILPMDWEPPLEYNATPEAFDLGSVELERKPQANADDGRARGTNETAAAE